MPVRVFRDSVSVMPEVPNRLVTWTGTEELTLRGELDKLVSNVGFAEMFAGAALRSDVDAGIELGEEVALRFLSRKLGWRRPPTAIARHDVGALCDAA